MRYPYERIEDLALHLAVCKRIWPLHTQHAPDERKLCDLGNVACTRSRPAVLCKGAASYLKFTNNAKRARDGGAHTPLAALPSGSDKGDSGTDTSINSMLYDTEAGKRSKLL